MPLFPNVDDSGELYVEEYSNISDISYGNTKKLPATTRLTGDEGKVPMKTCSSIRTAGTGIIKRTSSGLNKKVGYTEQSTKKSGRPVEGKTETFVNEIK